MLDWNALPKPIIALSPMADMTDSAFCRVVRRVTKNQQPATSSTSDWGSRPLFFASSADESAYGKKKDSAGSLEPDVNKLIVFREMVSSEAVVRKNDKTLNMTDVHPEERPLVQQIFGSDPATMAESARIIEEEHHPEGFDVNMGCPVYKIVHNFNGAALMQEPDRAAKIVKAMKAVIHVPLSIKIRLGWNDPTQCIEFAKVLEDAGADLITVHGRTKMQGYAGKADWEMIRHVKEAVNIPVLANGDIHQANLLLPALETAKTDGVLIARGALGNPWIFKHMFELLDGKTQERITPEERARVIRLHADLHTEQYGERGLVTFRKHLMWYFKGQPGAKMLREKMVNVSTMDQLNELLQDYLKEEHAL